MQGGLDWLFVFDTFKNDFVNFAKEEKSLFMLNSLSLTCKRIYKLNLVVKVINKFDCVNSSGKGTAFGYKNEKFCGIMQRVKAFSFVPRLNMILVSRYKQTTCDDIYGLNRRYSYKFNRPKLKTLKGYVSTLEATKCYHRTNSKCIMCGKRAGGGGNALYWRALNKK